MRGITLLAAVLLVGSAALADFNRIEPQDHRFDRGRRPTITIWWGCQPVMPIQPCWSAPQYFPPMQQYGGYAGGFGGTYQEAYQQRLQQLERDRQSQFEEAARQAGRRAAEQQFGSGWTAPQPNYYAPAPIYGGGYPGWGIPCAR